MKSAGVYRASADLEKWGFEERKFSGRQWMFVKLQRPPPEMRYLFTDAVGVFEDGYATAPLSGFNGAHESGGAGSENDCVECLGHWLGAWAVRWAIRSSRACRPELESGAHHVMG